MTGTVTVCGNGVGGGLLLKMKVGAICKEVEVGANVESCDSNTTVGEGADLFVTIKESKSIFSDDQKVAIVKSYTNRRKIEEDLVPVLEEFKQKLENLGGIYEIFRRNKGYFI